MSLDQRKLEELERLRRLRQLRLREETQVNRRFWKYREDPVGFVREVLGENPWSKQREIFQSVLDHKYTTVRSCHDSGKSWSASRVVAWWIASHPIGQSFVITTAPTYTQVRAILWREIHRAHAKGGLPGRLNLTEWLIGNELVGYGRKPADYDSDAFQGIHAPAVLVVIDEASGVPKSLWDAVETVVTSKYSKVLAIGNPDDPSGAFAESHKAGSDWNKIHISAWDTPNFTGEAVDEIASISLLDPAWVEDKKKKWGESSPLYVAKCKGEFPEDSSDSLIPLSWLENARRTKLKPGNTTILGVDVARYGEDETIIVKRQGNVVRLYQHYGYQDTMTTAGKVIQAMYSLGASEIRVDDVGVGAGVVDRLKELKHPVVPLNAGGGADDNTRFQNARAEWYWNLREMFQPNEDTGESNIDLDTDQELFEQLANLKYEVRSNGKIIIEGKDDMKARGMSSPDRADAVMLAFAVAAPPRKKGKFKKIVSW